MEEMQRFLIKEAQRGIGELEAVQKSNGDILIT